MVNVKLSCHASSNVSNIATVNCNAWLLMLVEPNISSRYFPFFKFVKAFLGEVITVMDCQNLPLVLGGLLFSLD